jgi:hypothetical protein
VSQNLAILTRQAFGKSYLPQTLNCVLQT